MIPIIKPALGDEEVSAVAEVLRSGWVTQGPKVSEFETAFAHYVGAAHAVAVSNCTAALHLALVAAGVGEGDEVVTPSHSFVATANAIRYCGATPVFADVRPDTFNVDVASVEACMSPRTRAILCVHQMGMPCELEALSAIASAHGVWLVEDAACAIGSRFARNGDWHYVGAPVGKLACFSFHPRKLLTTGDGGMVTTDDADLATRLRALRQHAMSVPDTTRHASARVTFESYGELGFNYRMTDIQAAVGLPQLTRLDGLIARRRATADRYRELLSSIPGLQTPYEPADVQSNWQSYCVRLPPALSQVGVMQALLDAGVASRRGIMCAHREPAFANADWRSSAGPRDASALSASESAQDECILLPLFDAMTDDEQQTVVDQLAAACRSAPASAT
ncbi:MAG: DegT/DnrJ/EryC1/StrS family aminotransferase [Pseudomonadota bacterium]